MNGAQSFSTIMLTTTRLLHFFKNPVSLSWWLTSLTCLLTHSCVCLICMQWGSFWGPLSQPYSVSVRELRKLPSKPSGLLVPRDTEVQEQLVTISVFRHYQHTAYLGHGNAAVWEDARTSLSKSDTGDLCRKDSQLWLHANFWNCFYWFVEQKQLNIWDSYHHITQSFLSFYY